MSNQSNNSKVCPRCGVEKYSHEFGRESGRKDGLRFYCKTCTSISRKAHYQENREQILAKAKKRDDANRDRINAYQASYRENNRKLLAEKQAEIRRANPEKLVAYRKENKEKILQSHYKWRKRRYHEDPEFRLRCNMSSMLASMIAKDGASTPHILKKYLGYTVTDLRKSLEKQFLKGMGWHNRDKWHIDHIIPKSSFKVERIGDKEFNACWSLSNLRPMWGKDNIQKSNKILFLC